MFYKNKYNNIGKLKQFSFSHFCRQMDVITAAFHYHPTHKQPFFVYKCSFKLVKYKGTKRVSKKRFLNKGRGGEKRPENHMVPTLNPENEKKSRKKEKNEKCGSLLR